MVSTKITLSKEDLSPPVYLAGSFTEWQPTIKLDHETTTNDSGTTQTFFTVLDLEPGVHQYKFRLGSSGDWWILSDSAPKLMDDAGNVNNVISVKEPCAEDANGASQQNESTQPNQEEDDKSSLGWSNKSKSPSGSTSSSDIAMVETSKLLNGHAASEGSHTLNYGSTAPAQQRSTTDTAPQAVSSGDGTVSENIFKGTQPRGDLPKAKDTLLSRLLCCYSAKTAFGLAASGAVLLALYMRY